MRLTFPLMSSVLFTCLSLNTAMADSASGGFSVRGAGAQTCAVLGDAMTSENGAGAMEFLAAWSAGYITHANRTTAGIYETMPVYDNRMVARLTVSLCQAHPEVHVETVLASLLDALALGAVTEPSEMLSLEVGELKAQILRGVFQIVQDRLIDENLLEPGTADGLFGPQSRLALATYQKKNSLRESGLPDPATLVRLLTENR